MILKTQSFGNKRPGGPTRGQAPGASRAELENRVLRPWPSGGHPWENSLEETRHRSGQRKPNLFHRSGPFWTQPPLAGIGPAGSKERLEIPSQLGADRPRRASSSPGPQTPRVQAAGRVESAGETGGPPRWTARSAGQCTASRLGADPFTAPGHCWLAGAGFPPGPAQRTSLLPATSSRSRRPPEFRSLPRTPSDALLPRATASRGRLKRSGNREPGKRGEEGFPASSAQRALALSAGTSAPAT